jgi:hypothetical protein
MSVTVRPTRPANKAAADQGPLLPLVAEVVPNHDLWLDSPNAALGGQSPRELLDTDQEDRVREIVLAYKYGVLS